MADDDVNTNGGNGNGRATVTMVYDQIAGVREDMGDGFKEVNRAMSDGFAQVNATISASLQAQAVQNGNHEARITSLEQESRNNVQRSIQHSAAIIGALALAVLTMAGEAVLWVTHK